jgi:hypothetical protein
MRLPLTPTLAASPAQSASAASASRCPVGSQAAASATFVRQTASYRGQDEALHGWAAAPGGFRPIAPTHCGTRRPR